MAFDRLAYTDMLKAVGLSDEQARAHAAALETALRDSVATRSDVSELRLSVKADLADFRTDLLKWLVPLLLAQAGLVAALVKLLPYISPRQEAILAALR
jgi:hypothetical protein